MALGVVLGSGAAGLDVEGATVIDRHGEPYALPHLIDHEANLRTLADAGCDRVLGDRLGRRPAPGAHRRAPSSAPTTSSRSTSAADDALDDARGPPRAGLRPASGARE